MTILILTVRQMRNDTMTMKAKLTTMSILISMCALNIQLTINAAIMVVSVDVDCNDNIIENDNINIDECVKCTTRQ